VRELRELHLKSNALGVPSKQIQTTKQIERRRLGVVEGGHPTKSTPPFLPPPEALNMANLKAIATGSVRSRTPARSRGRRRWCGCKVKAGPGTGASRSRPFADRLARMLENSSRGFAFEDVSNTRCWNRRPSRQHHPWWLVVADRGSVGGLNAQHSSSAPKQRFAELQESGLHGGTGLIGRKAHAIFKTALPRFLSTFNRGLSRCQRREAGKDW